jgi:hypothetical protein
MEETSQNQTQDTNTPTVQPVQPVVTSPAPAVTEDTSSKGIKIVEKITIWIMVLSALAFALISVLAIWGVISNEHGNTIGRSFGTVATIAFAALVVNVGANMLDRSKKK